MIADDDRHAAREARWAEARARREEATAAYKSLMSHPDAEKAARALDVVCVRQHLLYRVWCFPGGPRYLVRSVDLSREMSLSSGRMDKRMGKRIRRTRVRFVKVGWESPAGIPGSCKCGSFGVPADWLLDHVSQRRRRVVLPWSAL